MNEVITIMKKPGIKKCVRINGANDIPDFLKEVVRVEGDTIVLDCKEGEERCPLGSVIAYEQLESGKMNVWNKANWKETTKEIDGVFYDLPKPYKAIPLDVEMPQYIAEAFGAKLAFTEDGLAQLAASSGVLTCARGDGYLVIYGQKPDGSMEASLLAKSTPAFKEYYVVDETGSLLQTLEEYDLGRNQSAARKAS